MSPLLLSRLNLAPRRSTTRFVTAFEARERVQTFSTTEYSEPNVSSQDKIFIAMSSGVDSSVAAALLVRSGHPRRNLQPFYMANWSPSANPTSITPPPLPYNKPRQVVSPIQPPASRERTAKCTEREFNDVKGMCRFLGLVEPLHMNFEKEYWNQVFVPMLEMYQRGLTPNPDVGCNRHIKFGAVIKRLKDEFQKGAGGLAGRESPGWWLATGHYARLLNHIPTKTPHLLRSKDLNKDQTFYLSTLRPSALSHLLFPLGSHGLSKPAVKSLARELSLPGYRLGEPERPESMGLCFVEPAGGKGQSGFRRWLAEYLVPEPGNVVVGPSKTYPRNERAERCAVPEGTVVGTHQGLWHATVGEKSRLEFPQGSAEYQGRWYVSRKDPGRNVLEVVKGLENARLYGKGMIVEQWQWLGGDAPEIALGRSLGGKSLVAQFRHRQTPLGVIDVEYLERSESTIHTSVDRQSQLKIIFGNPAMAMAPGQSTALWSNDRCLGGGVISEVLDLD